MSDLISNIAPVTGQTAQPVVQASGSNSLKINGLPTLFNPAQARSANFQFMAARLGHSLVVHAFLQFRKEIPSAEIARNGTHYRIELDKTEALDGDDEFSENSENSEDEQESRSRKEKVKRAKKSWQKARVSILASLQKKSKGISKASKALKEDTFFSLLSKNK